MEDWRNKYSKISPSIRLDDLIGCTYCKTVFKACIPNAQLDTIFSVKTSHNFLICGNAGNGKRTLARAFAKEMINCGYSYVRMRADYLIGANENETCQNINSFFDDVLEASIAESAKGCYIFLEDISNLVLSKSACSTLDHKLELIASDEDVNTIVVATAEDVAEVPSVLKRTMFLCMADLPDAEDREDYLKSRLDENIYIERSIPYKKMAEMTEGFNYDMLNKLTTVVFMLAKEYMIVNAKNDGITVSEFLNVASFTLDKRIFSEIVENMKSGDNVAEVASVEVVQPAQNIIVQNLPPNIPQPSFTEAPVKEEPVVEKENSDTILEPQGSLMDKFNFFKDSKLNL